jgi:hypothetical protein
VSHHLGGLSFLGTVKTGYNKERKIATTDIVSIVVVIYPHVLINIYSCAFAYWRNSGAFKAQKGAFRPDTGSEKSSTLSWRKGADLNRCGSSYYGQNRPFCRWVTFNRD